MLAQADVQKLALQLDEARLARREVEPLTKSFGPLTLEDGYAIQRAGLELRLARGERLIGCKMGFTSLAKRQQMNLGDPIYGWLTDGMQLADGGVIELSSGVHPKAEPEIAFVTARELRGTITREEALAACSGVAPALEILDSRFTGFKYFSLPDVVADACSAWRFVLGKVQPLRELGNLPMELRIAGRLAQAAPSSAISGHPAESLVQLVAMLGAHGHSLPAGSIVLAGAATAAAPLVEGARVEGVVEGLGRASFSLGPLTCPVL